MKFTVNDTTYFVKWQYEVVGDITYTWCRVYDNSTSYYNCLLVGEARLKKQNGDKFCKNTGRKISLARALNKLFPNYSFNMSEPLNIKEESAKARAIAWQEYFKESKKRLK